ncbi:MAG TPA: helicase-related protein, partial [Candidatus Polarisedimenticolaceae bacterium]|nr:helicase-related protein [Candidatus Polarisedimenticolaceae bacterium]
RRIRRALASGAALEAVLDGQEVELRAAARRADREDPRLEWLAKAAVRWKRRGDKTLVFVAHRETLEQIQSALGRLAQLRVGLFHEELSPGARDIEVAQFRLPSGPSLLVSTECGGEGRNFEFCTRLVLFDLPWNPMLVEQRIGRLDRIGRRSPVEIVYFRPPAGLGRAVAELYESLGIFAQPLGGLGRELATVEDALAELVLSAEPAPAVGQLASLVEAASRAFNRVQQAAYHELHREPYRPELAAGILARVPPELEELTQEVVLACCEQLALHVEEHHRGTARYSIEFGRRARVESLPGVVGTASFLGTFDREEAVADESLDFFASGHPLVEGLLAHLDESALGRVALLQVSGEDDDDGFGLLALYRSGAQLEATAIDTAGRERPAWAELLVRRPLRSRRVAADAWTQQPDWPELIRSLARRLEGRGRPLALAAVRVGPRSPIPAP